MITLNPDTFAAWLRERRNAVVGTRNDSDHCPLANHLRDLGATCPVVFPNAEGGTYHVDGDYHLHDDCGFPLPTWANSFGLAVDTQEIGRASCRERVLTDV